MFSLEKFCCIDAVTGNEHSFSEALHNSFLDLGIVSHIDERGNTIAAIDNNSDTTVMLDAHIDQIGLVVKEIDNKGFIKFISAGGVDLSILPTAEVTVHGKKDLYGVIGVKPIHLQSKADADKKESIEDFYIDCGLNYAELKKLIKPGDSISFLSDYTELPNDYVSSKSLDNRVGVYIVSECLKRLKDKIIPYNISGLFSTQEEFGCRAAGVAAESIKPDIAIVVDVTFGISPHTNEENSFQTGQGITVAVGPNLDRRLTEKFIDNCKANEIPYSKEVCGSNPGTNSWSIQTSGNGAKCILVSVPIKYMHSTVEMVNLKDIEFAIKAICSALEGGVF